MRSVLLSLLPLTAPALAAKLAKTYPGDAAYPTQADWDALNSTIGGNLVAAVLPARACYPPISDPVACKAAAAFSNDDILVPQDPVLVQAPWWSGNKCVANISSTGSCELGNYPDYVVAAKNAQHVSEGVKFAKKFNLRLSVKNTGHDFLGRNLGLGSLSIWTYGLQGIEVLDNWFPTGAPKVYGAKGAKVVRYGTAIQFGQLYDAAKKGNVTVTVGAGGGWQQGGGHGRLSNNFGLGVDQVLEYEIVLPDGKIVIANKNAYSELFNALLGGGGGTWGITTKITIKAYPRFSVVGCANIAIAANPNATTGGFAEAMGFFLAQSGKFVDFGLTGYPNLFPNGFSGPFTAAGKTNDEVLALLKPVQDGVAARGGIMTVTPMTISDPADLAAPNTDGNVGTNQTQPGNVIFGSRLLSRKSVEDEVAMTKVLKTLFSQGFYALPYPILGGQVAKNALSGATFGLNPAWRSAIMHFIYVDIGASRFSLDTVAVKAAHQRIVDVITPVVDPLSVNSGAYLNEANYLEPNPKKTFWGGELRYKALLAIKKKYDPTNVFWCNPCIGYEAFYQGDDGKLYITGS
ncbi:FAD-binding domain-containing protein 8 [Elsinoe australis]|uniref:FAD-binding domain-containing protein 8 n=1 Tax=Elsinoe australis TaxID=40998 RepID=A0A4V6DUV7_9PEZI|nr:FAD-binding domain-containing protein 8 [Elsinoe australis]